VRIVSRNLASRQSRTGLTRVFAAFGVIAVTVVVLWALLVGLLWAYTWFRLGGIDLRPLDEEAESPLGSLGIAAPDDAVTVMVVLTEPRDPTRPVEPDLAAPVALVQVGGPRADAAVLLLPEAMPVTVDGDGRASVAEVHAQGGSELLLQAILDYTEVRIDHAVTLTVDALPELVDVIGEIELCMPEGCRPADGADVRAGQRDPDPRRVVRTVAGAMHGVASALEARSAITSPFAARRAVDIIARDIDTDVSLRGRELSRTAAVLARSVPLSIDIVPLLRHPVTDELIPLEEPAMVRFEHLRAGTPFEPREVGEEIGDLNFGSVRISVLNGAGIAGLAGRVEQLLIDDGFRTVGTGNAPAFARDRSQVTYRGGDPYVELAAIRLAELLDDAELELATQVLRFEGDEVDIVVTAGADADDLA
jgi:hypothetical protein